MAEDLAYAKVNLTLHITGQRSDGYHLLDSLVVFAPIADKLTISASDRLTLSVIGPQSTDVPDDGRNLVLKAAALLRQLRGVTAGADFVLEKHLPHGGGIGGGSADAAAALRMAAALWQVTPLSAAEALPLGADIPVCLTAPAPMHMRGIGEQLTPAPKLPDFALLLVNPGAHLATPDVFAQMQSKVNAPMSALPKGADFDTFIKWLRAQRNDMLPAANQLSPEIAPVISAIAAQPGCAASGMSGSGSTCWGIFAAKPVVAAAALSATFPTYWIRSTT
ncbi:MAG: 4-(cytidine 5'-diphospho)-2-C-methyl-D-erythritol kinase [Rhodobacteraceae bacterium]|nr:4-(cytidine 5'-diphospho)-2-C-methyl-D-erythritol kinase [Paracoccaceae bacterium]